MTKEALERNLFDDVSPEDDTGRTALLANGEKCGCANCQPSSTPPPPSNSYEDLLRAVMACNGDDFDLVLEPLPDGTYRAAS